MRLAGLAAALILAAVPLTGARPQAPAGGLKLERVVLLERHGVRSPTRTPEQLSAFSAQPWPRWSVAPGELTEHGGRDVRLMGAWLRATYASKGLWPAKGCPAAGQVHVWADGHDQRTRLSGLALLDGAFPGCGLAAPHGPDGESDPLFSAEDRACPVEPKAAMAAMRAQAGGDLNRLGPDYEPAKAALAHVLGSPASCQDDKGACFLNGANSLTVTKRGVINLEGPAATASTVTESLLLEYAEGYTGEQMGWGRAADAQAVGAIMPLHNLETNIARRTPYMAAHNGVLAMRAILAALRGGSALPDGGYGARLTAIAGHDTQLSNLSGILDADWTLPGQPDKTPPDAAMVFELWRAPSGERFVRVAIVYQTLADLRDETPLNARHPAGRVDLPVPGCADGPGGACSLTKFVSLVESRLPGECVLGTTAARPSTVE